MNNAPRNNIERTAPIPSRRSKCLVNTRLEIGNITGEHPAQNTICANMEEILRIEGRTEQISLLDSPIAFIFDGKLADDEFVEAIYN